MTHRDPPGRPRALAAVPVLLVIAVVVVGLLLAMADHWRRGNAVMAVAAALAALFRLVLPPRYVGPLAVRSKVFDIAFLTLLAALLTATAVGVLAS